MVADIIARVFPRCRRNQRLHLHHQRTFVFYKTGNSPQRPCEKKNATLCGKRAAMPRRSSRRRRSRRRSRKSSTRPRARHRSLHSARRGHSTVRYRAAQHMHRPCGVSIGGVMAHMFVYVLEVLSPGRTHALKELAQHVDQIHVITLSTMKPQIEVVARWLFHRDAADQATATQRVTVHAREDILQRKTCMKTRSFSRSGTCRSFLTRSLHQVRFIDDRITDQHIKKYPRMHMVPVRGYGHEHLQPSRTIDVSSASISTRPSRPKRRPSHSFCGT